MFDAQSAAPLSAAHRLAAVAAPNFGLEHDFVPGEIIVRFRGEAPHLASQTLSVQGVTLQSVRSLGVPGATLYRGVMDRSTTLAVAATLSRRADVQYAEPNFILQPQFIPNDPTYPQQWALAMLELPTAWSLTSGSDGIVIAIGDTGILFDSSNPALSHPDLSPARMLPGYDFISSPTIANDGDGRDPNPYDNGGDLLDGGSSYHGTHVAGIVGATTNNELDIAGVDAFAKILPVRMLGAGGGTMLDIVEGTLWAAGYPIAGVPNNDHAAHVINLSLGGRLPCPQLAQDAFSWIAEESPNRAIVVVAAGNEGIPAAEYTPGNCAQVLNVGAVAPDGTRPAYSNYGPRVDVMAPGGSFAGGTQNGVVSLGRNDSTNTWGLAYAVGTSMAAPHVAGIVALLKSLDPQLTLSEVRSLLTAAATPLTPEQCGRPNSSDCGAGLVDAGAAVALLAGDGVPEVLRFDPEPLFFGTHRSSIEVTLTNMSEGPVEWSLNSYLELSFPGEVEEILAFTGGLGFGLLEPNASAALSIVVDREKLTVSGTYFAFLVFVVNGSERYLLVEFSHNPALLEPTGETTVYSFVIDTAGAERSRQVTYSAFQPNYTIVSPFAGINSVVAWVDENGNGDPDDGDFIGFVDNVFMAAGQSRSNVNVNLYPIAAVREGLLPDDGLMTLERLRLRLANLLEGAD